MTRLLLATLLGVLGVGRLSVAFDVTQCGQRVPDGEVGVLQNDLTCTMGSPGFCFGNSPEGPLRYELHFDAPCTTAADCTSVVSQSARCVKLSERVGNGATFDLNGFSLSGAAGGEPDIGVLCEGRCTLHGPGELANFAESAVAIGTGGSAFGVAISNSGGPTARISDLTVRDSAYGITGFRLRLRNLTVLDNQVGIDGGYVRIDDAVTASGNDVVAVGAFVSLTARNLTANDNGVGVFLGRNRGRLRLEEFTAQNNADYGVLGWGGAVLIDSTITGNNGDGTGIDVGTVLRPRLVGTTCGKSAELDSYSHSVTGTWGVCAND